MKTIAAAALALAACGPTGKTADEPVPVDRKAACAAGDVSACVEEAGAQCTESAWQLEIDQPTPLYVAPSGVARIDRLGMVLLGTDGHTWLACVEECPGSGVKNVCIPFVLDLTVGYQATGTCERSERDVQPWNGHPARSVVLDCPGAFAEIAYVPGLAPVQKALAAAHVVDASGPLDLPGLVVNVNVAGTPLFRIHRATDASCAVFAVPEGHTVVRGADAYARATAMQPELESKYEAAKRELEREVDEAVSAARAKAMAEVRTLCQQRGYPDDAEGLGKCTFELDEARALITKAVGEALERYAGALDPKVDAALSEHVLTPLCREFAGR